MTTDPDEVTHGVAVVLDCSYYLRRRRGIAFDALRAVWRSDVEIISAAAGGPVVHVTVVDWKPADVVVQMVQDWAAGSAETTTPSSSSSTSTDETSSRVAAEVNYRRVCAQFHSSLRTLHSAGKVRISLARTPLGSDVKRRRISTLSASEKSFFTAGVRQQTLDHIVAASAVEYAMLARKNTTSGVTPTAVVLVSAADSDMTSLAESAVFKTVPLYQAQVAQKGLHWGVGPVVGKAIVLGVTEVEEGEGGGGGDVPVASLPGQVVDTEVAPVPDFLGDLARTSISAYQQSLRNEARNTVKRLHSSRVKVT